MTTQTIITKESGHRKLSFSRERLSDYIDRVMNIGDSHSEEFKEKVFRTIENRDSYSANNITKLLINTALENIDEANPEWQFSAARVYLQYLYKQASRNRAYGYEDKYGSYYGLQKSLASMGIYSHHILEKYSKEEIEEAESWIDPDKDLLFTYEGIKLLADRYLATDFDKNVYELPQERWLTISLYLMQDEPKDKRMALAKEAYWALSNLYMTVATPTLANAGKVGGQLSSCFPAETFITTNNGRKMIKDIEVGDKVLSHTGEYREVKELHVRQNSDEKLIEISLQGHPDILRATPEHPILTLIDKNDDRRMSELSEGVTTNIGWVQAKHLKPKDYVVIGQNKISHTKTQLDIYSMLKKDFDVEDVDGLVYVRRARARKGLKGQVSSYSKQINPIASSINIDYDFGKFIGLYLADGYVMREKRENDSLVSRGVSFTFNSNTDIKSIEFIENYVKDIFKISTHRKVNKDGSTNVIIHSTLLGNIVYQLVGTDFDKKIIHTDFYDFGSDFAEGLVTGVFMGDGTTTRHGVKLQLTNPELIKQIYEFMVAIKLYPSHRTALTKSGRIAGILELNIKTRKEEDFALQVSKKPEMIVKRANTDKQQYTYSTVDGYIVKRITKVSTITHSNNVYNLDVEDDHTYVANGVVVHNCFIDSVDDSLIGIYDSNTDVARMSKNGGGIGVYMGKVRGKGSSIRGYKGISSGVIPWIKQLNNTAVSVDQLGTRKGAIAVYLDVWHSDIESFLDLRLNNGDERLRAHDIFLGVSLPDLFMEQVEKRGDWYLFDPHEVRQVMGFSLEDFYDEERGKGSFRDKYEMCVNSNQLNKKRVPAIDIMKRIMVSQLETGMPFMFYRDEVNRMNPNNHAGIIYSSNLCTEIAQNMSPTICVDEYIDETDIIVQKRQAGDFVVCNLSSINLGRAVPDNVLERLIPIQVRMLDNVIDINNIEVKQAEVTNKKYRGIGLGAFGWHHLLALNNIEWESEEAVEYADKLYEDIAYLTIKSSMELAREKGAYPLFEGSEWQSGGYFERRGYVDFTSPDKKDRWFTLSQDVFKHGIRNGYLMATAPNGSTSNIAGSTASIDPVFKPFFYEEKSNYKLPKTAPDLNHHTYNVYRKSAYIVDQRWSVKQNAARQKHIDQSISFNLYVPNNIRASVLLDLHLQAWKSRLKTTYYVRSTSSDIEECEWCHS